MDRKELTKTFSDRKKPFGLHGLYNNNSALQELPHSPTVVTHNLPPWNHKPKALSRVYVNQGSLHLVVVGCCGK